MTPFDRRLCPNCGNPIHHEILDQPALFIACGHGATQRRTVRYCTNCRWELLAQTQEIRPVTSPQRVRS